MLVVVLQIPVLMASVSVVPVMRVVYQVRHAYLEPVSVEPLHRALELLPDPTVMLQTTFANVQLLLMLVVGQLIPVLTVFANAAQMMPVVTQERLAVLELVSAELPILVLVR